MNPACYLVIQYRPDGRVSDVTWNYRDGRLFTEVEANAWAAEDNAVPDGYTSRVIPVPHT